MTGRKYFLGLCILLSIDALFPKIVWGHDLPSFCQDDLYVYDGLEPEDSANVVDCAETPSLQVALDAIEDSGMSVEEFSGETRYDTASMQALEAYDSSEYVVIVGNGAWPDALAATGLAGVLDCPILLTEREGLTARTASAIRQLGAKRAILLGGNLRIAARVQKDLELMGLKVDRLAGETRQDTQVMVYNYGKNAPNGSSWSNELIAFASGYRFHDALSFSSVAFSQRTPVFLLDEVGDLADSQRSVLSGKYFGASVVLGGQLVTSNAVVDFARSISLNNHVEHIAGETRFDTSAQLACWAVEKGYLAWDYAAFVTEALPYDALAGSVLQGKSCAVVLMIDGAIGSGPAVSAAVSHRGEIAHIRFFGGRLSISQGARQNILAELTATRYVSFDVSLDKMLSAQSDVIKGVGSWSQEVKNKQLALLPECIAPDTYAYGNSQYYQFGLLNSGYSGLTAEELDAFINTSGSTGKLAGMGYAFVDASKKLGVNEVYLLAHAILESGWGKSPLASGFDYNGTDTIGGQVYPAGIYYNFYGIGAVDSGPLSGGRAFAVKMGWNSPYKAIIGAAQWIKSNYLERGQYTLYLMRWNPAAVASNGGASHQYATDVAWPNKIARVMGDCLVFCGRDMNFSQLSFEVPRYIK